MRKILAAGMIASCIVAPSHSSFAATLPAYAYIVSMVAATEPGPGKTRVNSSQANTTIKTAGAYAGNTINLTKVPYVSASVSAQLIDRPDYNNDGSSANSDVEFTYYMRINAPQFDRIPVHVKASGSVGRAGNQDSNDNSDASEAFSISDSVSRYFLATASTNSNTLIKVDQNVLLPTNTNLAIDMHVIAGAYAREKFLESDQNTSEQTAFGILDPYFSISPSYQGYSLSFSPGINNVPSGGMNVPLPASAPMFGAGLLALGAAGYVAKRKRAAAAA